MPCTLDTSDQQDTPLQRTCLVACQPTCKINNIPLLEVICTIWIAVPSLCHIGLNSRANFEIFTAKIANNNVYRFHGKSLVFAFTLYCQQGWCRVIGSENLLNTDAVTVACVSAARVTGISNWVGFKLVTAITRLLDPIWGDFVPGFGSSFLPGDSTGSHWIVGSPSVSRMLAQTVFGGQEL